MDPILSDVDSVTALCDACLALEPIGTTTGKAKGKVAARIGGIGQKCDPNHHLEVFTSPLYKAGVGAVTFGYGMKQG